MVRYWQEVVGEGLMFHTTLTNATVPSSVRRLAAKALRRNGTVGISWKKSSHCDTDHSAVRALNSSLHGPSTRVETRAQATVFDLGQPLGL